MAEPVARPLTSLEDVMITWRPPDVIPANVPLAEQRRDDDGPKILVCHDMCGGYQDDRFIQGCTNCDAYRITQWHLIDTFVYFSHHFITIPPPGWINAAHINGTKILGTLITEWKDGRACCAEFLASVDSAHQLADKLVEIAQTYQFDGWLINIENEIEHIDNLLAFVRYLTSQCHEKLAHGQVIWYDSVTMDGKLQWQDELNQKNAPFFEASDGIFLNYTWKESSLQRSRDVSSAGDRDRRHDVYVGIDVFGRGCIGGGGYNCHIPLDLIKQSDLSVAVFAPGWTHENHGKKHCHDTENKFWRQFETFPSIRREYTSLPLMTSFCTGSGKRLFHSGQVISSSPWFNLSLQQIQPNLVPEHSLTFLHHHDDGYHGGGCLLVNGSAGKLRLFATDTRVQKGGQVFVDYVIKPLEGLDASLIRLSLKSDPMLPEGTWEETDAGNGWIKRRASYRISADSARIREVVVEIDRPDGPEVSTKCSFLIGHIEIKSQDSNRPSILDVKFEKLPETEVNSILPFKVKWTATCRADHYTVLMQYMRNGQVLTSSDDVVTSPSDDVTDSPTRCSYLLGHTRSMDFLVTKLPEMQEEWDAAKFMIVPYSGQVYHATVDIQLLK